MVAAGEFWRRVLEKGAVEIPTEAQTCTGPYDLRDVALKLGVESYNAPALVSIDLVSKLPKPLRERGLYVVRTGQYSRGRNTGAMFILCKASHGYVDEAIHTRRMISAAEEEISIEELYVMGREFFADLGEAAASAVAGIILHRTNLCRGCIAIPSARYGAAVFSFQPGRRSGIYKYSGQVEVDAVYIPMGSGTEIYAVEAKSIKLNDAILKYKLAFSAQATAEKLGKKVYPVYAAYVPGKGGSSLVMAAVLEPAARPQKPYPIYEMKPRYVLLVRPR